MDILGQKRSFSCAYISNEIQFWFLYQVYNSSMNYLFQKDCLGFNRDNPALRRYFHSFFSRLEMFPISIVILFAVSIFWFPIHFGAWHLLRLMTLLRCQHSQSSFHSWYIILTWFYIAPVIQMSQKILMSVRMANFLQKYPRFAARQTEGKDTEDNILQRN